MLDQGFENDIRRIIERTVDGKERQTVMCTLILQSAASSLIRCSCSQRYLARICPAIG
jgi:superfamily II DNA/RNA helicase